MGIFKDAYSVAGPVDKVIKEIDPSAVFVYIPGCPPKPETMIMALVKALQKI
jgi:membrane-bound hydrogenase subunit mbhJ